MKTDSDRRAKLLWGVIDLGQRLQVAGTMELFRGTRDMTAFSEDNTSQIDSDLANRECLANKHVAAAIAIHCFVGLAMIGWYYLYYPVLKQRREATTVATSAMSNVVVTQSDFVVNYWYLLIPVVYIAFRIDREIMKWVAIELGNRDLYLYTGFVGLVMLAIMAVGQFLFLYS